MFKIPGPCAFHLEDRKFCLDRKTYDLLGQFLLDNGQAHNGEIEDIVNKAKKVTSCDTEKCILLNSNVQSYINNGGVMHTDEMIRVRFKQSGPRLTNDLLSNVDIDNTLKDMESAYKSFKCIKFHMIDFDRYPEKELNNVNLAEEYKSGVRTLACVLNTDITGSLGKHWFCLFVDMRKSPFTIEFFNSSGNPPEPSVSKWMIRQKIFLEPISRVEDIQVCSVAIQFGDTECGVYCLFYIYERQHNIPYQLFADPRTAPNDNYIFEIRKHLFS
jgi:hypothetical protein